MSYGSPYRKAPALRGVKNDGEGWKRHSTPIFATFFAAGSSPKHARDPEVRADGQGGLLRRGYYWKAEGYVIGGPFHTRRAATADALRAIHDMAAEDLAEMGEEPCQ